MDIFHIETASLSTNRSNGATVLDVGTDDQLPQVSFDGGPEFNLNFFDSPDDSNTGYSDPGSVDSTVDSTVGVDESTPPPQPLSSSSPSSSLSSQITFTTPTNFTCK